MKHRPLWNLDMKNKQTTTLLFCALLTFTSIAQTTYVKKNVSLKVKFIVHRLNKYDEVSGALIGRAPQKPEQYRLFEKLELTANESELFELTNHPNPTVRTYALIGLVNKNSSKMFDVLLKNQSDTILIMYKYGCLGRENTVIGFVEHKVESYVEKNKIELTPNQKALMERISEYDEEWRERRKNKQTDEK